MNSLKKAVLMTGDEAVAYAVKQSDVDFISAYPITPQTIIVERLSEYVASGQVKSAFIPVESEHSALSACIGASLCGARVFTSTSSQGLALMHEIMYVASGLRCPIVMAVANRALSAPINIHCDHSDMMGSRDSGWVQIFCESPQEAYHYTIQAFRLAEHSEVLLPVALNLDGFTVSHSSEAVETLSDEEVEKYLPRIPRPRLDYDSPHTFGVFSPPAYYFEFKLEQARALENAGKVVREVAHLYPEPRGVLRKFTVDGDGGRVVVVGMGGAMGAVRHLLSNTGLEFFSLVSVRMFSPFPGRELVECLSDKDAVVVMDRAMSLGMASPPLASNIKSILYDEGVGTPVVSVVYGLGGREPTTRMIRWLLNKVRGWVEDGSVRARVLGCGGEWGVTQITKLEQLYGREGISPGHSACQGCGALVVVRQVLLAAEPPFIVVSPTSCLEVVTSQYPYTAWRVPWIHVAFENAAAVASGIEAALRVLERKGRGKRHKVLVIAGDGGTYDIGLQALSGALERGHSFLYICYDNEAYMNTGIQRSAATPPYAITTTTPRGKIEPKKDIMAIVAAHNIPYAATASPHLWKDLANKVRKAMSIEGPTFLHVLAPCPRGWRYDPKHTIKIAKLAVETRIFPIYEIENGKYRLNYVTTRPRPVEEYLATQERLAHLLKPENRHLLEEFKKMVEERWQKILKLSTSSVNP